jgi:prepilin-type N-terminal cleavage/methylation domain-containing protein
MKKLIKHRGGFTLVEMITSIVLLGIIGVFTSLFLYTGIKGYMVTKQTNEGAMKAQIALDRINLELRRVNDVPVALVDTPPIRSITYTTDDLPGTRTIIFNDDNDTISIDVDGIANALLDEVETFNVSLDVADLNLSGDGVNEIAGINIGFTFTNVGGDFNMRIYPRNWVEEP